MSHFSFRAQTQSEKPTRMELAIRVNVRYVAPPNSKINDALHLFRSAQWVQFIVQYIMPQLNNASPAAESVVKNLSQLVSSASAGQHCVICMDQVKKAGVQLPCAHAFHQDCLTPWLKLHSTCPTCRHQLPTDATNMYSVHAINTTIVLEPSHTHLPMDELVNLPAGNQTIHAVVNARVRRNASPESSSSPPEMESAVVQSSEPVPEVQNLPRRSRRRRRRVEDTIDDTNIVAALESSTVDSRQTKRARSTRLRECRRRLETN